MFSLNNLARKGLRETGYKPDMKEIKNNKMEQ